ncbi:MAG: hypothetical protein K0S33_325 [Bacteroidetes bacterium]|jgi:nitrite reductase/ring-hydroxylating ferredoxin subunit|nr:hypothetical protein [Bacteroidota bacterium]
MQKKLKIIVLVLLVAVLSCKKKKNNTTSTNPNQVNTVVNVRIYKNTPDFSPLLIGGGHTYAAGGVSGLIIYRVAMNETNGDFVAFDRNCPHEGGTNLNAKLYVMPDLMVKDTICKSKFYISNGTVANGPSVYPMKQYNTSYDGYVLHIYN